MIRTDRHGNPTDDADRWLSGHEATFDYDPVDHECCPYGWGVERFEWQPAYRLIREWRANWAVTVGGSYPAGPEWFDRALGWTGFDFDLARKAGRVWDCLCGCCETHTEAIARYARWAKRATGRQVT
jgi:hypothetical protein